MKKLIVIFSCLVLVGCGSTYTINTRDGGMITSHAKPTVDEDTKMLQFEDEDGKIRQIPQSEVKQIVEN